MTLAFLALISASMASVLYRPIVGETFLTGVGEIARDGHSKIVHHGLQNQDFNPFITYDQVLQPQLNLFGLF